MEREKWAGVILMVWIEAEKAEDPWEVLATLGLSIFMPGAGVTSQCLLVNLVKKNRLGF